MRGFRVEGLGLRVREKAGGWRLETGVRGLLARPSTLNLQPRCGSALIVVLIVVVLLSLGAYTFFDSMLLERRASDFSARTAQSRALADSGIEYAAAMLGNPTDIESENLYHNPESFAGVTLLESAGTTDRGRFTIIAPLENDTTGKGIRYGLIDESSKLNINAIANSGLEEDQEHLIMMRIPGMTDEAADSILDFIDTDTEPRTYSDGETSTKNAACESLDELLLMTSVTPELLYGEDSNRNGVLDPHENDGVLTYPPDNEDGLLDLGFHAFFTIYAAESNLQQDGSERVNLNQALLTELYDELETEFGGEIALFITAFRLKGPVTPSPVAGLGTVNIFGNISEEIANAISKALVGSSDPGSVTRAGMDLSAGSSTAIVSLYELVNAQVIVEINGEETTLDSPWQTDASLATNLPTLLEKMSTTSAETINGRININQARKEVLLGIPGMPEDLPDQIAAAQVIDEQGNPLTEVLAKRATTGWLLIDGLVDLPTIQLLDQYICARGDVMTVQSVGCFDRGGATTRIEAVIDATLKPPTVIFRRDLTRLGPGYRIDQLVPAGTE